MIIELPFPVFLSVAESARERDIEIHQWLEMLICEVMNSNEIVQLRKDMIDWREELLS